MTDARGKILLYHWPKIGIDFPLESENRGRFPLLSGILADFRDRVFRGGKFYPTKKEQEG